MNQHLVNNKTGSQWTICLQDYDCFLHVCNDKCDALTSVSIFAAAGNSWQFTYFKVSKASVWQQALYGVRPVRRILKRGVLIAALGDHRRGGTLTNFEYIITLKYHNL